MKPNVEAMVTVPRSLIEGALIDYLADLSESHYAAGWLIGWEYEAWDRLNEGRFPEETLAKLSALRSALDGGWMSYSAAEWAQRYDEHKRGARFYHRVCQQCGADPMLAGCANHETEYEECDKAHADGDAARYQQGRSDGTFYP